MKRITHDESLYILRNREGLAYAYTHDMREVGEYLDSARACGLKYRVEYAGGITYYTVYED